MLDWQTVSAKYPPALSNSCLNRSSLPGKFGHSHSRNDRTQMRITRPLILNVTNEKAADLLRQHGLPPFARSLDFHLNTYLQLASPQL